MHSKIASALSVFVASLAPASSWTNPNGAAEHFTYANGQDMNGLFGSPVVSGDSFIFPGGSFSASAADGASDILDDTVSVDLLADPGWRYSLIRITAFGSYAATGDASVDVESLLTFEELDPPGRHRDGPMATNPGFPQTSASGGWSGLSVLDVTFEFPEAGPGMHLEYSDRLVAISGPGGSAAVLLTHQGIGEGFELEIGMMQVPEPATAFVVVCAALLGNRRRW